MKEFRIFGPPGTGKTTILASKYVPKAVHKYGRDKVMIVSFTKVAAKQIATKPAIEDTKYATKGRPIDIDDQFIGTLHKICYHALGEPKIVETDKELIADWNSKYGNIWEMNNQNTSVIDNVNFEESSYSYTEPGKGDKYLNYLNIKRNKLRPDKRWQPKLRAFRDAWQSFKKETDSVDFTDMIENAITELPYAPGQPRVMFVDEAQDFTSLQLKLCRSWAQQMEHLLLVGDDDQTIFRFAGASPEAFLKPPVADNMKTVLKQSYRVPRSILERSSILIKKVKLRENKIFQPRLDWYPLGDTAVGQVLDLPNITYKIPDEIIPSINERLQRNLSVMILASCSYMLDPIKKILKTNGLPFSNPYRRSRADWNPLYSGTHGISASELLTSFFNNGTDGKYWSVAQFLTWAKFIKVGDDGVKKKVGKKYIKRLQLAVENNEDGIDSIRNMLNKILNPNAVHHAMSHDVQWLFDNVLSTRKKGLKYPIKVLNKYGLTGIEKEPEITIGTIHSVKGAEADCVFLFPDFSMKADIEFQMFQEAKDSMYRLFYVGMTRAKHELILLGPSVFSKGIEKMFVEL